MDVAAAIEALAAVLNTVTNAVAQASQISSIIQGAQAQGRTTLTAEEWAIIDQSNAAARQALVAQIAKALSGT